MIVHLPPSSVHGKSPDQALRAASLFAHKIWLSADLLHALAGAEVPEQARHPGQQPLGSPGSTAAAAAAAASRASAAAPQANSEQGAAYGAAGMPGGATGRVAGALRTNSIPGGGPSSSAAASERATAGVGQSTGESGGCFHMCMLSGCLQCPSNHLPTARGKDLLANTTPTGHQ